MAASRAVSQRNVSFWHRTGAHGLNPCRRGHPDGRTVNDATDLRRHSRDGRTYPDHAGAERGALDRALLGPAGLVEALEAQFGLLGPVVPKAVRTAAYLAKLRAAGDGKFWSASFSKDAWSTAVLLLGWRDALVAGGWSGAPPGAARPDDLSAAERAGAPLPPGLADRLTAVLAAIGNRPGLRLERPALIELARPPSSAVAPVGGRHRSRWCADRGMGGDPRRRPPLDPARVQATLSGAPPRAPAG